VIPPPYGGLTVIADTSAWARADHPNVSKEWSAALSAGQIATSPIVAGELLYAARNGAEFDETQERLDALRIVGLGRPITAAALGALRDLAHQAPRHHRLPFQDALIAAAAQSRGWGVLHYDRHYDRLATVLDFESRWIAPSGSLEQ
jgi:predicted nucleic acid-binding protein